MDPDRKIIVGYDGSENSEEALALGRVFAEVLDAAPLVATVVRYPNHLMARSDLEAAVHTHAQPLFAVAKDRLPGFEVETRALADDSPAHGLHELAEAEDPLLIVLGSTHRGLLGRVFIGSVGESLLSGARCAIAVAPGDYVERDERQLRRIGVAVNGSPESWSALHAGISLAERLNANLTVVAGAEPPHYGYGASLATLTAQGYESREHEEVARVLDRAIQQVPHGLPVHRRLLRGDPPQAIAEAAKDFDLLIVGSRGYGPLRRTLLGGVSAKLMRLAPCPVLVLPRGAGTDPLGLGEHSARRANSSVA